MRGSVLLLGLLIIFMGRLVYWTEPLGVSEDESSYLSVVEAWKHYGELYVDAVDRKPPLLFAIYNGIADLTGDWNLTGVHFFFLGAIFFLALMAELLARMVTPDIPR